MKHIGIIKIDPSGRFPLPKETRQKLSIKSKDAVEIHAKDNSIIISKHVDQCCICSSENNLRSFKGKFICEKCIEGL